MEQSNSEPAWRAVSAADEMIFEATHGITPHMLQLATGWRVSVAVSTKKIGGPQSGFLASTHLTNIGAGAAGGMGPVGLPACTVRHFRAPSELSRAHREPFTLLYTNSSLFAGGPGLSSGHGYICDH